MKSLVLGAAVTSSKTLMSFLSFFEKEQIS
jgi:hypothetical protein